MNKAFFLDRDGTLNVPVYRFEQEHQRQMDCAPVSIEDFHLTPGAVELIDHIRSKGFLPIVVTNQPDYLKKGIPLHFYEEITTELCGQLGLERNQVFECFHKPGFSLDCLCRKPHPGMILMAKGLHNLDLQNSWILGDSWRDVGAGINAGVGNTIYLRRPKIEGVQEGNEKDISKMAEKGISPTHYLNSLGEVIDLLR